MRALRLRRPLPALLWLVQQGAPRGCSEDEEVEEGGDWEEDGDEVEEVDNGEVEGEWEEDGEEDV